MAIDITPSVGPLTLTGTTAGRVVEMTLIPTIGSLALSAGMVVVETSELILGLDPIDTPGPGTVTLRVRARYS